MKVSWRFHIKTVILEPLVDFVNLFFARLNKADVEASRVGDFFSPDFHEGEDQASVVEQHVEAVVAFHAFSAPETEVLFQEGFGLRNIAADASVSLAREDTETFESFSQQWLSRLESDKTGERIDAANRRKLRTLSYLLGWSGSEFEIHVGVPVGTVPRLADTAVAQLGATLQQLEDIEVAPPLIKLPVFGSFVDGVRGFDSGAEPSRYRYVVQSELPEGVNVGRLYFVRVSEMDLYDETLEPAIPVGAQLLIEARKTPKVGQFIVIYLQKQDLGVITRFSKSKENVLFRSYRVGGQVVWSSEYPDRRIGGVVRKVCFEP